MRFNRFLTLNKREDNPDVIAKKFEAARSDYLKDLAKLRKRYAATLADLTLQYGDACSLR